MAVRVGISSLVFVWVLMLLGPQCWCARVRLLQIGEGSFSTMFENMLPRGPVPPSGPSPCHNKVDLSEHYESPGKNDIICGVPFAKSP
ncbi:hypothetical protein AMTRI_Chr04g249890 [Amborella trichopoda]|uniref:Methyltransferase n=1 Tax=Amborella trichopoda TaxID=13333 RepID=W1P5Q4_AMBTC|nr:hypothetical protein AMTR_s00135p00107720 [Amborella trichopoda]